MVAPRLLATGGVPDNPKAAVVHHHGLSRRVFFMARTASPWFWEERQGWYVNKDGQRHFLGAHPEGAPAPRKSKGKWNAPSAITQAFHTLMADPEPKSVTKTSPKAAGPTVPEIFDKYLDWSLRHRAARTFDWYRDHIQSFVDSLPGVATMSVPDLKPFHVIEWADKHPDWSPAYRRGALIAIQRPFNWAEELGYIAASPIKRIKKPQPQRRENPVSPENFDVVLGHYAESDPFHDLLLFSWHSGSRPQEARHIEARHVNLGAECVVIPREEAKGKRKDRVIHLHGPALEVVKRLLAARPEGKLFVNEDGRPWKRFAIANRFDRLHLALGLAKLKELGTEVEPLPRFDRRAYTDKAQLAAARKEHRLKLRERRKSLLKLARQHGRKMAAYDLRHGFATRMLEKGVDHVTVAALMGHGDGTQVARTYQHLDQRQNYLKETLKKASGEGASG
jgi:integrase